MIRDNLFRYIVKMLLHGSPLFFRCAGMQMISDISEPQLLLLVGSDKVRFACAIQNHVSGFYRKGSAVDIKNAFARKNVADLIAELYVKGDLVFSFAADFTDLEKVK